jgi:hypothetical protein
MAKADPSLMVGRLVTLLAVIAVAAVAVVASMQMAGMLRGQHHASPMEALHDLSIRVRLLCPDDHGGGTTGARNCDAACAGLEALSACSASDGHGRRPGLPA